MNAGIADATNLSWFLAAHLSGWAPAAILDAYEAERLPITDQVSRFAMSHAEAEIRRRGAVPPRDRGGRTTGERAREEVGRLAYEINVQQYACAGLNFGTYYDRSPYHRVRWLRASAIHNGNLHALDCAGLPDTAFLAR